MSQRPVAERYRRIASTYPVSTLARLALEWGVRRPTAALRALPDFVIIGAQRCGTTSLYNYLADHPAVIPAFKKEIHYFSDHYDQGVGWYRAHFPLARRPGHAMRGGAVPPITGEASPYYLFHPHAARRAFETIPDARLIVLLRDPVDRAYSHYYHAVAMGLEDLTFEEAIAREEERIAADRLRLQSDEGYHAHALQSYSYLSRGIYVDQLATWLRYYHRERLLVLGSDDLDRAPAVTLSRVERFLGIDDWRPETFPRHHRSQYPEMNAHTRERLNAYFAPHNRRLYEALGQDWGWCGG